MNDADRTRQRDFVRLDNDHLALDAAQILERIARVKTAAVNGERIRFWSGLAITDRNDEPRFDKALVREKQSFVEAACKRRLELCDAFRIQSFMAAGSSGKALEIVSIPRVRDDKRAVERSVRHFLAP